MGLTYFEKPEELEKYILEEINPVDVVLDIGSGIYPINYFVPKFHILVEPHDEYVEILQKRLHGYSNYLVFQGLALEVLKLLPNNSVDSVFLIDVIEHLEKKEGFEILEQLDRVARRQIVIFTPLGFMPQHVEIDKKDRWGFHGGEYQEHKSGWLPEEFDSHWNKFVCRKYHIHDDNGEPFEKAFGAFYAVKNLGSVHHQPKEGLDYEFFRPTAQELELKKAKQNLSDIAEEKKILSAQINELEKDLKAARIVTQTVLESRSWKITSPLRLCSEVLQKTKYTIFKSMVDIKIQVPKIVKYRAQMSRGKYIRISSKNLEAFWEKSHKAQDRRWITGSSPEDELNYLQIKLPDNEDLDILVVGVGTGSTANHIANLGHNVDVLDVTELAFRNLNSKVGNRFTTRDYSSIPSNRYHLILHHLVAQHMSDEDLQIQLDVLLNSLNHGGKLHLQFSKSTKSYRNNRKQTISRQKKGHILRSDKRVASFFEKYSISEITISNKKEFPEWQNGWCWCLLKIEK